jgi:hypothetical protein
MPVSEVVPDGEHQALLDATLWAAGGSTAFPPELPITSYLDGLRSHRLDGRFLRRANSNAVAGPPPDLVDEVRERHAATCREVDARISLADAIGDRLKTDDLIVLKGSTLYGLTGERWAMRRSNDLDLISSDPAHLLAVTLDMGFEVVGPIDHLHEYASVRSEEFGKVDIHGFFPVTGSAGTAEELADLGLEAWRDDARQVPFGFQRLDLTHEVLWPHRWPHRGDRRFSYLGPEMAILVYAGHLSKEFLRHVYPRPRATLRLDEIATFVDLCRHPSFNGADFGRLVARTGAMRCVAFLRALSIDLLGTDPLSGVLGEADPVLRDRLFPRDLWWNGLDGGGMPVLMPWRPSEFVFRDRSMMHLVSQMYHNRIEVPRTGEPVMVADTTRTPAVGHVIQRVPVGSRITAAVEDGLLALTVDVPTPNSDEMIGIALYLENNRYELFCGSTDRIVPVHDYSISKGDGVGITAAADAHGDRRQIKLSLPPQAIGTSGSQQLAIAGILSLRRQRHPWGEVSAGESLPLIFEMPPGFPVVV